MYNDGENWPFDIAADNDLLVAALRRNNEKAESDNRSTFSKFTWCHMS